jgi:hypothetical protein
MLKFKRKRKQAKNLSAEEKEEYFIYLYVGRNAGKEHIPYCEKRAALQLGDGTKILAKKSVQADIKARMEVVRLNQIAQFMIGEAVAKAKAGQQRWVDPAEGIQR